MHPLWGCGFRYILGGYWFTHDTGERIANQKGALDLYVKAAELRQKGDELMFEAVQRTPEQKYVDGMRERSFQRTALAAVKL